MASQRVDPRNVRKRIRGTCGVSKMTAKYLKLEEVSRHLLCSCFFVFCFVFLVVVVVLFWPSELKKRSFDQIKKQTCLRFICRDEMIRTVESAAL